MTDLRKLAKGQDCRVRIPGICSFAPEQTVLAHLPIAGISGMGMKPPDVCGAWACDRCHSVLDRRVRVAAFQPYELDRYKLEGLLRTLYELDRMGYRMVKVSGS